LLLLFNPCIATQSNSISNENITSATDYARSGLGFPSIDVCKMLLLYVKKFHLDISISENVYYQYT
jgi:hypothetical protein